MGASPAAERCCRCRELPRGELRAEPWALWLASPLIRTTCSQQSPAWQVYASSPQVLMPMVTVLRIATTAAVAPPQAATPAAAVVAIAAAAVTAIAATAAIATAVVVAAAMVPAAVAAAMAVMTAAAAVAAAAVAAVTPLSIARTRMNTAQARPRQQAVLMNLAVDVLGGCSRVGLAVAGALFLGTAAVAVAVATAAAALPVGHLLTQKPPKKPGRSLRDA